ncbi:MAG: isoprenylcysteine carboxylmethyltransferase family protein [Thaumarchaeota archaeon]|nr:isoprenylcysteine carboxylmethyltransferase family protein [Nitrososphaerota archaeon]
MPPSLELQPVSRIGGWAILLAGAALALWLFRYRSPTSMIVSTYFTFGKMFTKSPISTLGGRTEPLVVDGPQRYVRHPLYLAATIAFLGWAIVTGSTSFFIGVIFILLWFAFVQIPFEEKELRAIFGTQYVQYSKRVPMLIPFTKHPHQEE